MTPQRLSERSLRVAFIGAGQMARNHLAAIQRLTVPAKLVGVTDCAPRAADQFAALAGIRPSFSIATLLAETRPDVVHVCTPPSSHFEAAYAALDYGAHVYVEKPFALTVDDGNGLITLARARRRLLCAGHQLLRDDAFEKLMSRVPELGAIVQVDSHFAFRPARASWGRAGARALAAQAIDILPHPLYTLVDVLERFGIDDPDRHPLRRGGAEDRPRRPPRSRLRARHAEVEGGRQSRPADRLRRAGDGRDARRRRGSSARRRRCWSPPAWSARSTRTLSRAACRTSRSTPTTSTDRPA